MLFTKVFRSGRLWAGVAIMALGGAGCAAQQANTPAASLAGAQVAPPGTPLTVGQGYYIMPALPPAAETNYALTGQEAPPHWGQPTGHWINGINGMVYVPSMP